MATAHATNADEPLRMQCMEVWGGNQPVDNGVVMVGLDAWVYSRPLGDAKAGGDVHYVSSCATGRITRLLVADVSGHGADVAAVAETLRDLMRRHVNYLDPTRFLRRMNREFSQLSQGGNFATAVVTTFFAPTNQLTICNAGHPAPMVYRKSTGKWAILRQSQPAVGLANIPLGVLDQTGYEQFGFRLRLGDLALCYTDSLVESKNQKGEFLGEAGLLEVLNSLDPSDPSTFAGRLLDAIRARSATNLTEDDVTVLLFRANGMAPRIPLRNRALAPFRLLWAMLRACVPGGPPVPWPEWTLRNIGGALFHRFNHSAGVADGAEE